MAVIVAAHEEVLRSSDPVLVGLWLRFTWFGFSVLSSIGSFVLARIFLSRVYALAIALICIFSYQIFFVSTLCFAELPFCLATILFAILYYKPHRGWLDKAGTAATAIAAYLLRTVGVALLIAWVADALLRRQFRSAAVRACVALTPVILWQSYIRTVETGYTYQHPYYTYQRAPWVFYNVSYSTNVSMRSPFEPELGRASAQDLALRFLENAVALPYNLGETLTMPTNFWKTYLGKLNRRIPYVSLPWAAINALMCLLGFSVLAGILVQFQERSRILSLYLILTIAAVCTTPWPGQSPRYLAPTMPFLLLALLRFTQTLERWACRTLPRMNPYGSEALSICTMSLVVLGALVCFRTTCRNFLDSTSYQDSRGIKTEYRLLHYPVEFTSVELAMLWLSAHAEPHSVVAASMPQWTYLNTGLKTVMPPLESNSFIAQKMLDSVPVTFLILDHMTMEHGFNEKFQRLVRDAPSKWIRVHSEGGVSIYKRDGM